MVVIATITYKNQLTIPQDFMEKLGLTEVRKVLISSLDDKLVIEPLRSRVDEVAGSLSHLKQSKPKSLKQIKNLTRQRVAAKIAREGLDD